MTIVNHKELKNGEELKKNKKECSTENHKRSSCESTQEKGFFVRPLLVAQKTIEH